MSYESGISPEGVAAYAYLNKMDQFGKFAVTLLLPKGVKENDKFDKDIRAAHAAAGKVTNEGPSKDGDKRKEEEFNGFWTIDFHTKNDFKQVDAQKVELPKGKSARTGDLIRVAFNPATYDGFGGGITMYLNAIQIIDKRATGAGAEDFTTHEGGYSAPAGGGDGDYEADDNGGDF